MRSAEGLIIIALTLTTCIMLRMLRTACVLQVGVVEVLAWSRESDLRPLLIGSKKLVNCKLW